MAGTGTYKVLRVTVMVLGPLTCMGMIPVPARVVILAVKVGDRGGAFYISVKTNKMILNIYFLDIFCHINLFSKSY
jgi:hypothetical protein